MENQTPDLVLATGKRKAGRWVCAEETIEAYASALRNGANDSVASRAAGVPRDVVQGWLRAGADGSGGIYSRLYQATERARALAALEITQALRHAALPHDEVHVRTFVDSSGDEETTTTVRRGVTSIRALQYLADAIGAVATTPEDTTAPARDVIDAEPSDGDDTGDLPTDTAGQEAHLRARVQRLRRQLLATQERGNAAAAAAVSRQLIAAEDALLSILPAGGPVDPAEQLEPVYLAEVRAAAAEMAEVHLRIFAEEWLRRHRLQTVAAP